MMRRRDFIKSGSAAGMAAALGPALWAQVQQEMGAGDQPLPKRELGSTGEMLSVVGFGGIVVLGGTQTDADRRVHEALDRGVNYVDVAPTYGRGEAERRLGVALKGKREALFLACKTTKRDKAGAAAELENSLKQLNTDRFDLYQMHAIKDVEKDVQRALRPDGAMAAFVEARDKGQVRYLGFSAHSAEAALAAIDSGMFDTILYPVNFVCHYQGDFDQEVLRRGKAKKMGLLALKSMARTRWPKGMKAADRAHPKCWYEPVHDPAEAALALRWTLGQGVTAAIPPGDETLFRVALNIASKQRDLDPGEAKALKEVAANLQPLFARA